MSEASPTKQKLDEFRVSLPTGDEHTEPTWEMLSTTSYACKGTRVGITKNDFPRVWGTRRQSKSKQLTAAGSSF